MKIARDEIPMLARGRIIGGQSSMSNTAAACLIPGSPGKNSINKLFKPALNDIIFYIKNLD